MRDHEGSTLPPEGSPPEAEPFVPTVLQGSTNDDQECQPKRPPVSNENHGGSALKPGRVSAFPLWKRFILILLAMILGAGISFGLMQWLSMGPLQFALSSRDRVLQESNAALARSQQELEAALASLESSRKEYMELSGTLEQIQQEAITPPYIYIHGRQVSLAFHKSDSSLIQWEVPFDELERSIDRGFLARNELSDEMSNLSLLNSSTEETYKVVDFRPFVDSSPFAEVMPSLYQSSSSDAQFLYEVWNIIGQLSQYTAEIEETPRFPLETLLAGGGDCEDTSILFASMVRAAGTPWSIELVYMDLDYPDQPQNVNHVIVSVDTGNEQFLVETTSNQVMEPYPNGVNGWWFLIDG